jgi:hypothetical protein
LDDSFFCVDERDEMDQTKGSDAGQGGPRALADRVGWSTRRDWTGKSLHPSRLNGDDEIIEDQTFSHFLTPFDDKWSTRNITN